MSDPSATPGIPTSARAVLATLGSEPLKLLVAGGVGTGKSTALAAARRTLRESGVPVSARIPDSGEPGESAVVIDDAHLLTDAGLRALTDIVDDPARTVVVAAEPRNHDPGLRDLAAALEREFPRVTLGPLPAGEIARLLTDPSGHPPPPELLAAALAETAGLPLLISAVGAAPRPLSRSAMRQAAGFALTDRLRRLDLDDLEALLIASLSVELGGVDVAAALGVNPDRGTGLIDRARATGLVQPSHGLEFHRTVHRVAAQILGATRHHEIEIALVRTQLAAGSLPPELAVELAGHGVRDDALAQWLRERATCRGDAAERVRTSRAAVQAGATDLRPRLADALALNAELSAAAALADDLLGAPGDAERAVGVRIASSVATHEGNSAHAAELFGWLGLHPDAIIGAAAAMAHLATGDLAAARAALDAIEAGPPTAPARAARSLAEGLLATVEGRYPSAAVRLGQAVAVERTHPGPVLPDSAAALTTLAALHAGDSVRARSVITRAVRDGAAPVFTARHRLLLGWVRMQDGQLSAAAGDLNALDGVPLAGRDALWAAALRTAIARRGGDPGALQSHLFAGLDVMAEYSVDLMTLLPLGELWMAAARLGQHDRLAPALDQACAVLTGLGRPSSWSAPFHWAGVHAGILAGDPSAVAPHGQALATMASETSFASALASAGRTWLRVLAKRVDADEVMAAARGLAQFGLTSDATRLAGQAALHAQDGKVSGLMLQVARDLRADTGDDATPADRPTTARVGPTPAALSDREREVAELLLLGLPYRDIGAQLFISAKTVEHHVARIRRRLGAESRSEMLSMLRAMLAAGDD